MEIAAIIRAQQTARRMLLRTNAVLVGFSRKPSEAWREYLGHLDADLGWRLAALSGREGLKGKASVSTDGNCKGK